MSAIDQLIKAMLAAANKLLEHGNLEHWGNFAEECSICEELQADYLAARYLYLAAIGKVPGNDNRN